MYCITHKLQLPINMHPSYAQKAWPVHLKLISKVDRSGLLKKSNLRREILIIISLCDMTWVIESEINCMGGGDCKNVRGNHHLSKMPCP